MGDIVLSAHRWPTNAELIADVARLYLDLRRTHPGLFFISVPRHVERSAEIAAALDEIRRTSDLPAPLIGRYLLSFDPVEVMVRAPDRIPGAVDN